MENNKSNEDFHNLTESKANKLESELHNLTELKSNIMKGEGELPNNLTQNLEGCTINEYGEIIREKGKTR